MRADYFTTYSKSLTGLKYPYAGYRNSARSKRTLIIKVKFTPTPIIEPYSAHSRTDGWFGTNLVVPSARYVKLIEPRNTMEIKPLENIPTKFIKFIIAAVPPPLSLGVLYKSNSAHLFYPSAGISLIRYCYRRFSWAISSGFPLSHPTHVYAKLL